MDELYELRQRAMIDFDNTNLDPKYWDVFWIGYMSAVKRFGGN